MECTIEILRMWYNIFEPFDTDVKSSIIESVIEDRPEKVFKTACVFFQNGLSPLELKKWICHKDFLGDLDKTASIYDKMTPAQKASLRLLFIIDVNNAYSMRKANNGKGAFVM